MQGLHATRGLHRRLRSPRPNLHSPKKGVWGWHMKCPHGRKGVPALREMCGTSVSLLDAKGALTEHPPGAGAPTGSPAGEKFPRAFGQLLVHVLGSRNYHSASRSLIQANRSLGPARPQGTRRGEISESLWSIFSLFFKATHWVLGPLRYMLWVKENRVQGKLKGLIAEQRAGPLFRQTDGVQQG